MTPEDEEFNRIEMESRIKQEYIRAMRKTTREEKISRPAVYEVPANNRMIASHQDHVRRLMDELAIARVCIRELGDRLSRLEKPWVGLTRDEQSFVYQRLHNATSRIDSFWVDFANAIEAKLKEKNA
jgi:hypothetical protein